MKEALKKWAFSRCWYKAREQHGGKWGGVWSPLCPCCCNFLATAEEVQKTLEKHKQR